MDFYDANRLQRRLGWNTPWSKPGHCEWYASTGRNWGHEKLVCFPGVMGFEIQDSFEKKNLRLTPI